MKTVILFAVFLHGFLYGCISHTQGAIYEEKGVTTLYVAEDGNDLWSGTIPLRNIAGNDGPFATLGRARDAIRVLKINGDHNDFKVLVRGGLYHLSETLTFTSADSGTKDHPLIFRAFENENPILRGTIAVKNLKPHKGQIYRVGLRETIPRSKSFRQLFADGRRQILARFPNYDSSHPISGGYQYVENAAVNQNRRSFVFKPGTIKNWNTLQDAEVFIFPGPNYWNDILPIEKIDYANNIVTLKKNASFAITHGNRYYFQNIFDELDSAGEWYLDHSESALYYWPSNERDLASVEVPVLNSIVEVAHDENEAAPSDIRIEGFTFEGCEGSAILVKDAKRVVIARCRVSNAGSHGIEIQGGSDNIAVGNDVYSVGGSGLIVAGGDRRTLTAANNRAENNYVRDVGIYSKISSGIVCKGVGNHISHNLIHSTPRMGISFDGNDHVIEYNHVHHVNQETQDSGIIYSCAHDWTKRGNVIRFNYVHDSGGYGRLKVTKPLSAPFYTWGIYLDDWTSGTTVFGNVVARTHLGGILIHGGRDNIIENNIIVNGGAGQMVYSSWPTTHKALPSMFSKIREMGYTKYPQLLTIDDAARGATMSGNSFVRNIVYYTHRSSMLYDIRGELDLETTESDYNVIYHNDLPLLVPYTQAPAERQWQTWLQKGQDRHSLIAAPILSDIEKDDYRLSPASPAFKLGFQPIPFDKIGPYQSSQRASWPIQ